MAGAPRIKAFNPAGEYRAAFKDPSEAGAFIAGMGIGWSLRAGHRKDGEFWRETAVRRAFDSFDAVADAYFDHMQRPARSSTAK